MSSEISIQENVPLAPLTTLDVGGPARYFLFAETEDDVIYGFDFARQNDLPVFVLGGGSNLLISDTGFNGLVIRIGMRGIYEDGEVVTACAGEDWDEFVARCVDNDLAGIECLSGIPGTIGGTPVQNVGAYGQEVSETIVKVSCYDRQTRKIVDLSNKECEFRYRVSIFNTTARDRYVVLSVTYGLEKNGEPRLAYKDLIDAFGSHKPTLKEVRDRVLQIRRSKSMVIDSNDQNRHSAGSFFKNPVVDADVFDRVQALFDEQIPHFPVGRAQVKIPAAWLIEHAGFHKGFALGNAGISTRHTLAIINRGGATAAEIVSLKNTIQNAVLERSGIALVPEPVFVGDFTAKN